MKYCKKIYIWNIKKKNIWNIVKKINSGSLRFVQDKLVVIKQQHWAF